MKKLLIILTLVISGCSWSTYEEVGDNTNVSNYVVEQIKLNKVDTVLLVVDERAGKNAHHYVLDLKTRKITYRYLAEDFIGVWVGAFIFIVIVAIIGALSLIFNE